MDSSSDVTVVLGDEYDDDLRNRLVDALRSLGGTLEGTPLRGVAGSQDFESMIVDIGGSQIRVEAETYIGLSISGNPQLVQRIRDVIS